MDNPTPAPPKITIEDAVNFVWKHRGTKICRGWTYTQIAIEIMVACQSNSMAYYTSPTNELLGLVIAKPDKEQKILWVRHILTIRPGVMEALIQKYHEFFQGWQIIATRHGKKRVYQTDKFMSKIDSKNAKRFNN